jgi:CheY-like chemotaxis protein
MLNRKIVRRILESENERLPNCYIKEADDGITALEMVTSEAACGIHFDFILIDYIMVFDFYIDFNSKTFLFVVYS